jgi:hypothetical protein
MAESLERGFGPSRAVTSMEEEEEEEVCTSYKHKASILQESIPFNATYGNSR